MNGLKYRFFIVLAMCLLTRIESRAGSAICSVPTGTMKRFQFVEPHMGTEFRIIVYGSEAVFVKGAASKAFSRIAELDNIFSDYRSESELSRFCRRSGDGPVKISSTLFEALLKSQKLSERSDGAFDVTISPVVRLWRRARRRKQLPSESQLEQAKHLVDYRKLLLDSDNRTASLCHSGMKLDLGGIAKGMAADEALRVLDSQGLPHALVAAGGDIVVGDPPPGRKAWEVAIASPDRKNTETADRLLLCRAAVSTSGDTEQFVIIDGVRYSHIVDPRTGIGLTRRIQVTVVAPNGTTSDSLATAVSVMGPRSGLPLVASFEGTAVRVTVADDQGVRTIESPRFREISVLESPLRRKLPELDW